MTTYISASHQEVANAADIRRLEDEQWRRIDAARGVGQPPSKSQATPAPPTKAVKPARAPAKTKPKATPAPALPPGSLVLSAVEVAALEHLLAHPDVAKVLR